MNTSANLPRKIPAKSESTSGRSRRRIWPIVVGLLLVGAIVAGLWPKAVPVEVAAARVAALSVTVNDEGQTKVKNRYVVSSPVGGLLKRVDHKAGATVVADQTVLAVLETGEPDLLDARSLAQAQARLSAATAARAQALALSARAEAAANLAKADIERARQLFERGATSKQDLDLAVMRDAVSAEERRAAEFALQVAQFEEQQARAMLERGQVGAQLGGNGVEIRSPVSGRILRVMQESQRMIAAGAPLLEVGDPTDLEAWIEVLSRDGVTIRPGATVWLDQWGGLQPLRATVRLVEPSAWTKISALGVEEQRVWVIADLKDPVEKRATLGDAYRVEARIVVWESDRVLQVPAGSLFQQQGKWRLYAVVGGRAQLRDVQIGHSNGLVTEILEGVTEGEEILVYPGDRVKDGVRVTKARN